MTGGFRITPILSRPTVSPGNQTRHRGYGRLSSTLYDVLFKRQNVIVLFTVVVALVRLFMAIALPYDRVVNLFEDDAFYYFGVARHIAAGDGSTFNSIDLTNGYHPLWLLLLVPIFAVTDGRGAFVGVTVLSGVFFILSGLLLTRLGKLVKNFELVAISAAPLLLAGTVGPTFWFAGMETGLLLTTLLALAVVYVRSDGLARKELSTKNSVAFGVLLAIAVLARLDTVFIAAALSLVALWTWRHRPKTQFIRMTLGLALPPAIMLTVYVVVNSLIFGTGLPVSGQAKALGGGAFNLGVFGQFLNAPLFAGGNPSWFGAFAVIVVPVSVWLAKGAFTAPAKFAFAVLVSGILVVCYYASTSTWKLWPWYFYAAPLSLALAGPALLSRANVLRGRGPVIHRVCIFGVLLLAIANGLYLSNTTVIRAARIENAPQLARQMADIAPVEAPLAMGDWAGSVGFHLDRPLVHLEGLVGSSEYLEAWRSGQVHAFLKERDLAFYARADTLPGRPKPQAGLGCTEFLEPDQGAGLKTSIVVCPQDLVVELPLPDGTGYRVWRYRPEINN